MKVLTCVVFWHRSDDGTLPAPKNSAVRFRVRVRVRVRLPAPKNSAVAALL